MKVIEIAWNGKTKFSLIGMCETCDSLHVVRARIAQGISWPDEIDKAVVITHKTMMDIKEQMTKAKKENES